MLNTTYFVGQRVIAPRALESKDKKNKHNEFIVMDLQKCPHKEKVCPATCESAILLTAIDGKFSLLECGMIVANGYIQSRFINLGNDAKTFSSLSKVGCNLED
jgi:hypothetical protein